MVIPSKKTAFPASGATARQACAWLFGAFLLAAPSLAGDVATLLKELEQELSALDEPVRPKAESNVPTQTFKALAIDQEQNPADAALLTKIRSLKARIASQRQHVMNQFADGAAGQKSHVARIAASSQPKEHPITNLKVYLDDVLVFAAEPLKSIGAANTTIFENTLAPRDYKLKITASRLVSAGDVMRLEEFTVHAPWPISADQNRHLALIKPIIAADGKASFEVLFD